MTADLYTLPAGINTGRKNEVMKEEQQKEETGARQDKDDQGESIFKFVWNLCRCFIVIGLLVAGFMLLLWNFTELVKWFVGIIT